MATLENKSGSVALNRAGRYALTAGGEVRHAGPARGDAESPGMIVAAIGDFLVAGRGARDGPRATINGRAPLGSVQRLADGDVVEFRPGEKFAQAGPDGSFRFAYGRDAGPAVHFSFPDSCRLRCAYTGRPLAGAAVVRCNGCFRLYLEEAAWEDELGKVCPACGWSAAESPQ